MKIIKLDAIDSTNSFLKELSKNASLENYTIVLAKNQTAGRGQQNSLWFSEPFKNLTFSLFLKGLSLEISNQKYLSLAISLAIYEVLKSKKIPKITIKWPNDIMSGNSKICGILIENSIQKKHITSSIIGIGLNVNQEYFDESTKKASSLKNITGIEYHLDDLLTEIIHKIKEFEKVMISKKFELLEKNYVNVLFKKGKPTMFRDVKKQLFVGVICGISASGNILIETEEGAIKEFGIKEISFV